jgi:kynurenine formamidase
MGVDFADISGLKALGVHNIPPMIGRGVMIDMAMHRGKPVLDAGESLGPDDIKAAAKAQGVEIRQGDVIMFHTGWTDAMLESNPKAWFSGEPGIDNAAAVYLARKNVMAVGADTWGVDFVPLKESEKVFYGHVALLKKTVFTSWRP